MTLEKKYVIKLFSQIFPVSCQTSTPVFVSPKGRGETKGKQTVNAVDRSEERVPFFVFILFISGQFIIWFFQSRH